MATLDTVDLARFQLAFEELASLPDAVVDAMLQAEAEVVQKAQAQSAKTMLQGPYNRGAVAAGVHIGKAKTTKDGRALYLSFSGQQHGTRVAEIAFLNEFGKKGQPPRQFIRAANEKSAERAVQAASDIYDNYLKQQGF